MVSRGSTVTTYFDGDSKGISDASRRAQKEVEEFGRSTGRVSSDSGLSFTRLAGAISVGTLAAEGLTTAAGVLGSELRSSIRAASDMAETQSKVGVVFGESAGQVREWGDTAATAMGLSTQKSLEAAATIGNFAQSLGLSREAAVQMSPALVQLASDLASFNNASPEDTLLALRSGLAGEPEPMRRFGVALNAAAVEAKALEMGLARTKAEIDEADKVTARYALIMDQTKSAQGDFARTSNSLANETRTLTANMENLRAKVGEGVAPALAEAVGSLNDWMESDEGIRFTNDLAAAMSGLASAVGGVATGFTTVIGLGQKWRDLLLSIDKMDPTRNILPVGQTPEERELARLAGSRAAGLTDAEAGSLPRSAWPERRLSEDERVAKASAGLLSQITSRTEEDNRRASLEAFNAQVELAAAANQHAREEQEAFARSVGGSRAQVDDFSGALGSAPLREAATAVGILEQASLTAADATMRHAEALAMAEQRVQQWFASELQSQIGRGTRFAPGVFEGLARAGGMTPLADLIAGGATITQTDLATGITTPVDIVVP